MKYIVSSPNCHFEVEISRSKYYQETDLQALGVIYHRLKYSTGTLKLLNCTFQHNAIGIQVLEEGGQILRTLFDITEQRHRGTDSTVGSSKLCGTVAGQRRQSQELCWSPLVNCRQKAVGVLRQNKKVTHALLSQKLVTIGIFKAFECELCMGLIVDVLEIHSSSGQTRDCRCIASPPAIFTRRNPQGAEQRSSGPDSRYPVGPLRNAHFAPRYAAISGYAYGGGDNHDCPLIVPSHSASNVSWRNRNTSSIGGGK